MVDVTIVPIKGYGSEYGTVEVNVLAHYKVWVGDYSEEPDAVVSVEYALSPQGVDISEEVARIVADALHIHWEENYNDRD